MARRLCSREEAERLYMEVLERTRDESKASFEVMTKCINYFRRYAVELPGGFYLVVGGDYPYPSLFAVAVKDEKLPLYRAVALVEVEPEFRYEYDEGVLGKVTAYVEDKRLVSRFVESYADGLARLAAPAIVAHVAVVAAEAGEKEAAAKLLNWISGLPQRDVMLGPPGILSATYASLRIGKTPFFHASLVRDEYRRALEKLRKLSAREEERHRLYERAVKLVREVQEMLERLGVRGAATIPEGLRLLDATVRVCRYLEPYIKDGIVALRACKHCGCEDITVKILGRLEEGKPVIIYPQVYIELPADMPRELWEKVVKPIRSYLLYDRAKRRYYKVLWLDEAVKVLEKWRRALTETLKRQKAART